MCSNGRECIPSRLRCDDTMQCSDGSDELGCPSVPSNLNLMVKIYPTEQTIEEGGEVVFQCRDEGPLRARVSWSRSGGLAMPDRSFNYEGRLTIPNSKVSHAGTYICQAIDYPGIQGSTASAFLRVRQSELKNDVIFIKLNFKIALE